MMARSMTCCALGLCSVLASAALAVPVDFQRDVQPIFADRCFHCHGPDEAARKAKLRLDVREGAFRERDGKRVLVPGKRAESELWRRIASEAPDVRMPPPRSNRSLSAAEIALLGRWIDEGASWAVHWSFVPPVRPELPP